MPLRLLLLFLTVLFAFADAAAQPAARRAALQALRREIRHLNYLRYDANDSALRNFDDLERAPSRMEALARRYAAALTQLPDTTDYEFVSLAHSKDRRLTLLSWDTRTGGTMIEYAAIAIYRGADGALRTKRILEKNEAMPNPLMHYDAVHRLATAADTIYIAQGYGQGSTALPWQELRAFRITGTRLEAAPVFPGNRSTLLVEFDTHDFEDGERIPVISVDDSARRLLLPEPGIQKGFDGYYTDYRWHSGRYRALKKKAFKKPKAR